MAYLLSSFLWSSLMRRVSGLPSLSRGMLRRNPFTASPPLATFRSNIPRLSTGAGLCSNSFISGSSCLTVLRVLKMTPCIRCALTLTASMLPPAFLMASENSSADCGSSASLSLPPAASAFFFISPRIFSIVPRALNAAA